jgi:hypothetical protein
MRELKGDWRDLFNGFMVALDLRKCFLALCGIVVSIVLCGGVTITLGNSIDKDYVTPPRDLVLHKWWRTQCQAWHVIYGGAYPTEAQVKEAAVKAGGSVDVESLRKGNHWLALGYSAVFGLLLVAIWSYFGGAIARIAAYEIAKDGERIETRKALQFARRKFWSFFWAPLICVIGLLFFALCNYVGGLVGKLLDYIYMGSWLVALFLPLALLSGFIITLILVGTVAGFPLFAPAVAAEGTDSFDAVSRGFSYVYSRPWHYLWYQIVSSAYGYVCIGFVILFSIVMCHIGVKAGEAGFELCGAWQRTDKSNFHDITNASWQLILSDEHRNPGAYRWDAAGIVRGPHPYGRLQTLANSIVGVDYEKPHLAGDHPFAAFILTLWLAITLGLALGYVVSYAVSQQTLIYFILRKKVDGIEMDEVFEEAEEEAKPAEAAKPMEAKPGDAPKPAEGASPASPAEPPKEGEKK